jgi:hypothetical protein
LNIRCIPSADEDAPPVIREIVPVNMEMTHAEVWTGEGSVGHFDVGHFDPVTKLKVVRYESAMLFCRANSILHHVKETFPI